MWLLDGACGTGGLYDEGAGVHTDSAQK